MADETPTPETVTVDPSLAPDTTKRQVLVAVTGPNGTEGFNYPDGDGGVIEITRKPTVVTSKAVADQLIALAGKHGVTIAYVEVSK